MGPVRSPKAGMPCFASASGKTMTCNQIELKTLWFVMDFYINSVKSQFYVFFPNSFKISGMMMNEDRVNSGIFVLLSV